MVEIVEYEVNKIEEEKKKRMVGDNEKKMVEK